MFSTKMDIFAELFVILTVVSKVLLDKSKSSQAFAIFTEGCIIRNYPLVGENIKNLVGFPQRTVDCLKSSPFLNSNQSHIWVEDDAIPYINKISPTDFFCCYTNFIANNKMGNISYGNCIEFSVVIKAQHEFVRVECFYLDNKIHIEFFLFPKLRPSSAKKDPTKFNVLIFGIESVSRMNFLRTMPETADFLHKRGSVQLLGYNKVGDNSYPNLFPLLTGQSFKDVLKKCIHTNNTVDSYDCIYIWDYFKDAGYVTAVGADSTAGLLGSYEYNFRQLPSDFYLQPFIYETRALFKNTQYNYHLCAGNKLYYKILLDYISDLSEHLEHNNMFGLFWEESVSHEQLNDPRIMDNDYSKLLLKLEDSGYLDETVVIFLSDHGMRWGDIVLTDQGRLEERLPLLEVLFPQKFKNLYKLAYQNFKENSGRLITPYDIYYTLIDLLNPVLLTDHTIQQRSLNEENLNKSSLFVPVSEKRTCALVGISEHWCTCYKGKSLQANHKSRNLAARHLITHINSLISDFPQCHALAVDSILDVSVNRDSQGSTFRVMIQASPGGGIFDGTLRRERGVWAVSGTVSRANLYRGQNTCFRHPNIVESVEMYCYCV